MAVHGYYGSACAACHDRDCPGCDDDRPQRQDPLGAAQDKLEDASWRACSALSPTLRRLSLVEAARAARELEDLLDEEHGLKF